MKKYFLALFLLGSAQATNWEYATLTEHSGGGSGGYLWEDPSNRPFIEGNSLTDIMTPLVCKGNTYADFFNCVGGNGWEFIARYEDNIRLSDATLKHVTYLFKKQK